MRTATAETTALQAETNPDRPRFLGSEPIGALLAGAGIAALVVYMLWLGRGLWFYSDDWNLIAWYHRDNFLTPFNGHLSIVPVLVYRLLFATAGIGTYVPYRVAGLIAYAFLGVMIYLYGRTRVPPVIAALASLAVMWYSAAQLNVSFPVLLNFSLPLALLIAIWMLLDRKTSGATIVAAVLLLVALATSGVALVAVVAIAVELAWTRAPWRRWVPFAVPVVLYGAWYVRYHAPAAKNPGPAALTRYALHMLFDSFSSLAGRSTIGGWVLIIVTVAVLAVAVTRWHNLDGRLVASAVAVVANVAIIAWTRAGWIPPIAPSTPRYLWTTAFLIVVMLVHAARGRVPAASGATVAIALVAAVIVVANAARLVPDLRDYRTGNLQYSRTLRTYLLATEAVGERANPNRVLPMSLARPLLTVSDYLGAVHALGSPINGVGLNDLGTQHDREQADAWMLHDLHVAPRSASGVNARCTPVRATATSIPRGGSVLVLTGPRPAQLRFARFADEFPRTAFGAVGSARVTAVAIPRDHSSIPWRVQVSGTGTVVYVCPA